MGNKNPHLLLFIWALAQISETTAELKIEASNTPFGEVTPSDVLQFTVTVSQVDGAKLDATNLRIRMAFPWYITYSGVNNDKGLSITTQDLGHGNIEFTLPGMQTSDDPIAITLSMTRNTTIHLHSGWHSIVTPMKLKYETVLNNPNSGGEAKKELTHSMPFIVPGCASALGMASGNIAFYQVEASSALPELRPDKARLGQDAWCAQEENMDQWIQITLKYESRISAIATYARKEKESWVTEYFLQYSSDGVNWIDYSENGFTKRFDGNVRATNYEDRDTPKKHWLLNPVTANYIRFKPQRWEIALCMRLELYGCPIRSKENCIKPLGMEDSRIPDEALSHNVVNDDSSKPNNVRLNKVVTAFPFGWLAPKGDKTEWLQIDLGSTHKIDKVAIQGSFGQAESGFFVTVFKIQYSNNSVTWNYVKDKAGQPEMFTGPWVGYEAVFPKLLRISENVEARYLRIIPEEYFSMSVMRLELYGCMVEDQIGDLAASPVQFSRRTALLVEETSELYACVYNEDGQKSSCMMTKTDGKKWNMLDNSIISVVAHGKKSDSIYAINRVLGIVKSGDKGETWETISEEEWLRMKQLDGVTMAKNIPDIFPGSEPNKPELTFIDANENSWGISGAGIHTKAKGAASWVTAAKWKCCGQ